MELKETVLCYLLCYQPSITRLIQGPSNVSLSSLVSIVKTLSRSENSMNVCVAASHESLYRPSHRVSRAGLGIPGKIHPTVVQISPFARAQPW
ncbi:hypothetical protein H5410_053794 [Solanum commersonii]|uniref:Uncharacterized protein n=1 Tax=Solanum commersonii TaxID=4109 RepID=A0A9J5X5X7_SOLCO|nr:hypothetical protein H5410_053794 [Solanum commersonii]